MSDLSSNMEEQNQLKFAALLSPTSKKKFVTAMMDVKMLRFEAEKKALKNNEDDDDIEVLGVMTAATPPMREAVANSLDDDDSVDSSPGDNRVRNEHGDLVVPENLQAVYDRERP